MCMIVFVLILLYGSAFIKNKSPAVCHAAQCQDEENVISDDYIVCLLYTSDAADE